MFGIVRKEVTIENSARRCTTKYKAFSFILFAFLSLSACLAYGTVEEEQKSSVGQGASEVQRYTDTQNNVAVEASVQRTFENRFTIEFISQPSGAIQLKSVKLTSPNGTVYTPQKISDVNEEEARKQGRLAPATAIQEKVVEKNPASKGAFLLGAALTAVSHVSVSSGGGNVSCGTGGASHSGVSGLGIASQVASPLVANQVVERHPESQTAGNGIFSSVAEFDCPSESIKVAAAHWNLTAEMQHRDGTLHTYTFILRPDFFVGSSQLSPLLIQSIWYHIRLTGPGAKPR